MNPIVWSLTLLHPAAVTAFGAGYLEDSADVPGEPTLLYTLRGEWQPAAPAGEGGAGGAGGDGAEGGTVHLVKQYTTPALFGIGPTVHYDGRLVRLAASRAAAGADVACRHRGVAVAAG